MTLQVNDERSRTRRLVDVTPTAWTPRQPLDLAEWIGYGKRFGSLGRACGWWMGDWLNFGSAAYGQKYSRAARISKYEVQTLMNMAYVASRFDPSRRRESVSWSHHAELAPLLAEDQDRWLDRVEADRLTVRDLRQELRREAAAKDSGRRRGSSGQDLAVARAAGDRRYSCPRCGHSFSPPAS